MIEQNIREQLDALVEEQRKKGLFQTKKDWREKVQEHHNLSFHWIKNVHSTNKIYSLKDTPGSIMHVGDVPYSIDAGMFHGFLNSPSLLARYDDSEWIANCEPKPNSDALNGARRWNSYMPQITQKDIHRKASSVRHAIARYIPRETFASFLDAVLADPCCLGFSSAFQQCFDSYGDQFKVLTDKNSKLKPELAEKVEDVLVHPENYPKDALRYALVRCKERFHMEKETNLAMTLIAYQAVHVAYLQEFEDAVRRNTNLTFDERENALSVLHGAFKEFHHFATFAVVAPLILLERKQIVTEEFNRLSESEELESVIEDAKHQNKYSKRLSRYHPDSLGDKAHMHLFEAREHEFNRMAIKAAWKSIFSKNIFDSHHTSGVLQKCPASKHLNQSSEEMDMIKIYDTITQGMNLFFKEQKHKGTIPPLVFGNFWPDVDEQTAIAVKEAWPWHPAFQKILRTYVDSMVEKGIHPDTYRWILRENMGYEINPADYQYERASRSQGR